MRSHAAQLQMGVGLSDHNRLPGARLSQRQGRGLEFQQLRDYQHGDDSRLIDWRVSLRTGKPHVRVHSHEYERDVYLVVDQSASMFFGSMQRMKSVSAAHCAALAAWRALLDKDRVGAILFSDQELEHYRPRRSQAGLLMILQQIVRLNAELSVSSITAQQNRLLQALRLADQSCGHDNLVVVISDFSQFSAEVDAVLRRLDTQHDLVLWSVYDPLELDLASSANKKSDQWLISDGNQQAQLRLSDQALREEYSRSTHATLRDTQYALARYGQILRRINTIDDVIEQLATQPQVIS